nr:MAG TPA: hypothetical protein [Bacteriophage sp.]
MLNSTINKNNKQAVVGLLFGLHHLVCCICLLIIFKYQQNGRLRIRTAITLLCWSKGVKTSNRHSSLRPPVFQQDQPVTRINPVPGNGKDGFEPSFRLHE